MTGSFRRFRGPALATAVVIAATLAACGAPDSPDPGPSPSRGEVPAPAQRSPSPAASPAGPTTAGGDAYADPASITVVVNKRRPLDPIDFAPSELVLPDVALAVDPANALLVPAVAEAVEAMFAAAADDGVGLTLVSGYRSYPVQEDTYAYWVNRNGSVENADNYSARPGFSEHQTGLAFDIGQDDGACTLRSCFRDTEAAVWAADNAPEFGFILRYPEGQQDITGFFAESWHYRYVGVDTAVSLRDSGTATLEERFALPEAPDYG